MSVYVTKFMSRCAMTCILGSNNVRATLGSNDTNINQYGQRIVCKQTERHGKWLPVCPSIPVYLSLSLLLTEVLLLMLAAWQLLQRCILSTKSYFDDYFVTLVVAPRVNKYLPRKPIIVSLITVTLRGIIPFVRHFSLRSNAMPT